MARSRKMLIILFFSLNYFLLVKGGKKSKDGEKPAWAKKDIRDYNEADLERLLDQWDVRFIYAQTNFILLTASIQFVGR